MKRYQLCIAATIAVGQSFSVAAETTHRLFTDRHTIVLGAYHQDADAEFFADANNLPRAAIDLGDLGMDEKDTSWMAEYRFRYHDDWLFSVGAYKFDTSGSRSAIRDFAYDGVEYQAGTRVDSKLEADTYIAEALYRVYHSDKAELFIGGGLHIFDFSTELNARAFVGEEAVEANGSAEDVLAPLPNLRAQGIYAISSKWAVSGTLGWFSLDYDDYDGSFAYLNVRTGYRFGEHIGVELGYQIVDLDFSVDRNRGEVGFDIQFNGPSLHLSYSF